MPDETFEQGVLRYGYRRRTVHASTLLNEEGAFDGDVVEVQLAYDTEKGKGRQRNELVRPCLVRRTHHWEIIRTDHDSM